ncbi:hypothetical protein LCGC14_3071620 [marine sediment metagenome]|uniref:Uncharacterized protein n=1 Tax=marine sediment metagenome TaxID=412755 RepID=A0A0F8X495_9ZZZZ
MTDPTYEKEKIEADPIWRLAYLLSEFHNHNAPIGWSNFISDAQQLLEHYEMTPIHRRLK